MEILSLLGTAAILTLAVVCLLLYLPMNYTLFVATGQAVFKWCFIVLAVLFVGRMASLLFQIPIEIFRPFNSIVFILCVLGIVYSVARKSKKARR